MHYSAQWENSCDVTHGARNLLGSALGVARLHLKSSRWPRRLRVSAALSSSLSPSLFF